MGETMTIWKDFEDALKVNFKYMYLDKMKLQLKILVLLMMSVSELGEKHLVFIVYNKDIITSHK